jgi:hypothetical protein
LSIFYHYPQNFGFGGEIALKGPLILSPGSISSTRDQSSEEIQRDEASNPLVSKSRLVATHHVSRHVRHDADPVLGRREQCAVNAGFIVDLFHGGQLFWYSRVFGLGDSCHASSMEASANKKDSPRSNVFCSGVDGRSHCLMIKHQILNFLTKSSMC